MKRFSLLSLLLSILNATLMAQSEINLYDNVPNSKTSAIREGIEQTPGGPRINHVIQPTLTIYIPANTAKPTVAVIICPGGAYTRLAIGHEGHDVAKELNKWGIAAFVLKYRLPNDTIMQDKKIGPLQDAQRAIQLVTQKAKEWNIDTAKIGIMGFSAGGHLAATASTLFNHAVIENAENMSLRPGFSILIYPVISFSDSLAHAGSRDNLLGKRSSDADKKAYSAELNVTSKIPPTFLLHAGDDKTVPVNNSIVYYQALLKNKVPAEMHIYPSGGHGFGMINKITNESWMPLLRLWLEKLF